MIRSFSNRTPVRGPKSHAGFTIIELLVILAVIGTLVALIIPTVQSAREASRRTQCRNNLKTLGVALQSYYDASGYYPPAAMAARTGEQPAVPYSIFTRLLPYFGDATWSELVDWRTAVDVTSQPDLSGMRISSLVCPADLENKPVAVEGRTFAPSNYGVNLGEWLVLDRTGIYVGEGAFAVNRQFTVDDITDGLGNTLAFAEVKAQTPYLHGSQEPGALGSAPPAKVEGLLRYLKGTLDLMGHTSWADGQAHQTGFTTTCSPNYPVLVTVDGAEHDVDFTSAREADAAAVPTYAAVTSRSWHPELVNVLLLDGASREVSMNIDLDVWRSLGTRAGEEPVTSF